MSVFETMEIEEEVEDVLTFAEGHRIYFDTTAFMSDGFRVFLNRYEYWLAENGVCLYTIQSVVNQLEYFSKSENHDTAQKAQSVLELVHELTEKNLLKIKMQSNTSCAPKQNLLLLALHKRRKRSIAIVTCNTKLANDILLQNQLKSCKGSYIYCFDISNGGILYNYDNKADHNLIISDIMEILAS